MSPDLYPVTRKNFAACVDFLIPREFRCVTLMSHLVPDGEPVFPVSTARELLCLAGRESNGDGEAVIDGVLLCTRTGILFHCIRESIETEIYAPAVKAFLERIDLRCVLGTREHTRFIESHIFVNPYRAIDYQLMTMIEPPEADRCKLPELGGNGPQPVIVQARNADAEELLPLQEGYEKEEVIPPGDPFNRDVCLGTLKLSLARQRLYAVSAGGKCIAKAGTNARGLNWDQIGGVYTLPEWRGKGIASALVAHTVRERMKDGHKCVLFVKTANIFAQKAYQKAGFKAVIPFRIAYY